MQPIALSLGLITDADIENILGRYRLAILCDSLTRDKIVVRFNGAARTFRIMFVDDLASEAMLRPEEYPLSLEPDDLRVKCAIDYLGVPEVLIVMDDCNAESVLLSLSGRLRLPRLIGISKVTELSGCLLMRLGYSRSRERESALPPVTFYAIYSL